MRLIMFAALLPLAACGNAFDKDDAGIAGSGTGNTRSYAVADFTGIRLAGSDDVEVRVGGGYSVRAEGDARVLDRLKITRDGATLNVSRRSGPSSGSARVFVTLPALTEAAIGGSGDMRIDRVRGDAFAARIAGSGDLTIGDVAAGDVDVTVTGSGNVAARGQARRLVVRITGSGGLDASQLAARGADVQVVGSGSVRTTVTGDANVRSVGSGDVDLGPQARCTVKKAGSGDVRCGR